MPFFLLFLFPIFFPLPRFSSPNIYVSHLTFLLPLPHITHFPRIDILLASVFVGVIIFSPFYYSSPSSPFLISYVRSNYYCRVCFLHISLSPTLYLLHLMLMFVFHCAVSSSSVLLLLFLACVTVASPRHPSLPH